LSSSFGYKSTSICIPAVQSVIPIPKTAPLAGDKKWGCPVLNYTTLSRSFL